MLKPTSTPNSPAAIGPYSQAISYGNLLFTSGQIPLDPESGEIVGQGISEQAERVMKNLGAVLEANGIGFEQIIKTTCFLSDMANFGAFNDVYARYCIGKPARSCVAVRDLPKGVLCEVEAIAALDA